MSGHRLLGLSLSIVIGLAAAAPAAAPDRGFLERAVTGADGKEVKYAVFVPHDYDPQRPVPTILFLHGSGETGTDGWRQTRVGLGKAVRERESTFPFLVVFPQAQKRRPFILDTWFPGNTEGDRALAILDAARKEFSADPKRLYLTGISMGGFGTWALAARFPDLWAAIAPVCGGGDPGWAANVKHLPCWCFHGDQDRMVNVEQSRRMVHALRALSADPRYTEYEGVGHNSWDRAYGTGTLFDWLLRHTRK